jgi:hypothetical protein
VTGSIATDADAAEKTRPGEILSGKAALEANQVRSGKVITDVKKGSRNIVNETFSQVDEYQESADRFRTTGDKEQFNQDKKNFIDFLMPHNKAQGLREQTSHRENSYVDTEAIRAAVREGAREGVREGVQMNPADQAGVRIPIVLPPAASDR